MVSNIDIDTDKNMVSDMELYSDLDIDMHVNIGIDMYIDIDIENVRIILSPFNNCLPSGFFPGDK